MRWERATGSRKANGPWSAWIGAAFAGGSTLVYVWMALAEGVSGEEVAEVAGIAASLVFAAVCAAGAAMARSHGAAVVLLSLAVIPLVIWGVLGLLTVGGLFLASAAFLLAALVKVNSVRPRG